MYHKNLVLLINHFRSTFFRTKCLSILSIHPRLRMSTGRVDQTSYDEEWKYWQNSIMFLLSFIFTFYNLLINSTLFQEPKHQTPVWQAFDFTLTKFGHWNVSNRHNMLNTTNIKNISCMEMKRKHSCRMSSLSNPIFTR